MRNILQIHSFESTVTSSWQAWDVGQGQSTTTCDQPPCNLAQVRLLTLNSEPKVPSVVRGYNLILTHQVAKNYVG